MALGRPLALEGVLARHPKLRVSLMHAGWPYRDETIAVLAQSVPAGLRRRGRDRLGRPAGGVPRYLLALVRVGFGDRIMFGSDGCARVDAIGLAIDNVDSAPFLGAAEKRAIFFDNAARFFRLDSARVRALTAAAEGGRRTRPTPPR